MNRTLGSCLLVLLFVSSCSDNQSSTGKNSTQGTAEQTKPTSATPEPPPPEIIAQAFGLTETVTLGEISPEPQPDRKVRQLWGRVYKSPHSGFTNVSVALFEGGTRLTSEQKTDFDRAIDEWGKARLSIPKEALKEHPLYSKPDFLKGPVYRFPLDPARQGYVSLAALGPGGGAVTAVVRSPDSRFDLELTMLSSNSDPNLRQGDSSLPPLEDAIAVIDKHLFKQ